MADAIKNFAYGTVLTAPSPATSGTSLVLNSGQGANFAVGNAVCWPANVNPTSANAEIVRVTAISTDTLTITRAQESTTAQSIAVGWQVQQGVTAGLLAQYAALSGATFTGEVVAPDFKASGLTGATSASRYVGATTSGAPASGTFAVGDFVIDQTGKVWVCTTAGTPGTWTQVGGGASLTHSSAYLGADTTIPAATTKANLVSLSLAAGTWLVSATVTAFGGSFATYFDVAVGPTSASLTSAYFSTFGYVAASNGSGVSVDGVITLASTTTVYLIVGSESSNAATARYNFPTANSTGMTAVKIA